MASDPDALSTKRLAVSLARIKLQACQGRLDRRGGVNAPDATQERVQLETAAAILSESERELRAFPARPILPFEIAELLNSAVDSCQSLLAISSRNLGRSAVDARFLKHIEAALQRNVRIIISLTDSPGDDRPAIELERLRGQYPRLELNSKKRGVFHHLICDDSFALICNRPLLGNQGKVCTFHHVVGFLLQDQKLVRAFIERNEARGNVNRPSQQ